MLKFQKNKIRNLLKGNLLTPVGLIGLAFVFILALVLLFLTLNRNERIFPSMPGRSFTRELGRYDDALASESFEQLEKRLDRLEKQTRAQDEWLSLLKRRRNLARQDSQYLAAYQKSAREAVKAFPYSEALTAVAAESLLKTDPKTNAGLLQQYAEVLSQQRFAPLALSIYALTGVLGDPVETIKINDLERLLSSELMPELKNLFRINAILLDILNDELLAATVELNALLGTYPFSRNIQILGGEFFYDYGNPLRAAELFSALGENYIGRTADALALAGNIPAARNIWTALASPAGNIYIEPDVRSLYNLASTSNNEQEAAAWLERIFSAGSVNESQRLYGIIRYTRLYNTARSIALLEDQNIGNNPLLDLELVRRRLEQWPLDRATAETWLLLGRHQETEAWAEALYQWAAWFFERQRLYTETAQLMKIAGQRQISAPWLDLIQALTLIRTGSVNEGYNILETSAKNNPPGDWRLYANMARVMEGRRTVTTALELYQHAASLADNNQDRSLIQLRISRCLEALGQVEDAIRALEYALELDPENFTARTELYRLDR